MQKFRWLAILMGITILGITGFQLYWLKNNYDREKAALELRTNASFRQTLLKLQASKLKLETLHFDPGNPIPPPPGIMLRGSRSKHKNLPKPGLKEPPISMMNLLQEKMNEYASDTTARKPSAARGLFTADTMLVTPSTGLTNRINTITISSTSDTLINTADPKLIREIAVNRVKKEGADDEKVITVMIGSQHADSIRRHTDRGKSINTEELVQGRINFRAKETAFRFLYEIDSLSMKDSVTVKEISAAYASRLKQDNMRLGFSVNRIDSSQVDSSALNEVTIGFIAPVTYKLLLPNKMTYILRQLTLPILFSFFLISITIASFVLLYRSLLKQKRLAELKNQFISNITHELKTPIATVGVAIEALQNFNAMHDPQRTKEYLDISQNELQRLGLLVDKVLKLSVFEKKEIELKKEQFDCRQLTQEIMNSMKLQFDKYHAKVRLHTEGDNFIIDADKLHVTSVIYNLLDNALKYSKDEPAIDVKLSSYPEYVEFSVSDNGIGIEPEYRKKIFDKFFRVPTGDRHNIKGYGLGLSYVAEVIKRHHGQVYVQSEYGKGSTFTAKIPFSDK